MILDSLDADLKNIVAELAKKANLSLSKEIDRLVFFDISAEKDHGDYATSCALKLSKQFKLSPRELADQIVQQLNNTSIEKISIEGPGFINVFIKAEDKANALQNILAQGLDWGKLDTHKGSVLVEFVSSNPTGPLHVGHGRGAILGMVLSNLLENSGYQVTKEYYVNDAGRQIAILTSSLLLNAYCNDFDADGTYEGEYIHALAQQFKKTQSDNDLTLSFDSLSDDKDERLDQISAHLKNTSPELWNAAREFAVTNILQIIKGELEEFGINHDTWFHESSLGSINKSESDLAKSFIDIENKGHTYKKDGASWFKSTDFADDKDRVLVRENGEPTYYMTDVGYHKNKIDRGYDLCINVFGADHHGYIPRLTAAFDVMKNDKQDIEFMLYQLVNLFEDGNKRSMSTRRGEFYSLEDLRKELGPDVIKFFFLEKKSDHTMDFDINLAKEESKNNPYFYSQYAYVRCNSILRKKRFNSQEKISDQEIDANFDLLVKVLNFPKHIKEYTEERSPHSLVHFVKELAASFHSFYETSPVICDDEAVSNARLLITETTKLVIEKSFRLLNVKPLEKM